AEALARAEAHPAVIEALGEPLAAGRRVRGEVDDGGPAGRARLALPLSGPRGSGRLLVDAERRGEVWSFTRLELRLDDGEVVDLLAAPPPPADTGTVVRLLRPAPRAPWHAVGIDGRS
ncbi:MAG TPA: cytochrome c oxidase assembly factor Coa1 family protein, partial [Thermoanaerobaculia bacterium]|nr:cytochrome c oxidase assembly factor Coa1 family protein [Thermoanaerobaculia bacterium]